MPDKSAEDSAWVKHVKAYQAEHGGSYKQAMVNSKASYTRTTTTATRAKLTPAQKAARRIKRLTKKFDLNVTVGE